MVSEKALPGEVREMCKVLEINPANVVQYRVGSEEVTIIDKEGRKFTSQIVRLNEAVESQPIVATEKLLKSECPRSLRPRRRRRVEV